MPITKSEFEYDERKLEVRAFVADNEFKVRVFENDVPVTGIVYTVTIETAFDAKVSGFSRDLIDELMALAESDVKTGRVRLKSST